MKQQEEHTLENHTGSAGSGRATVDLAETTLTTLSTLPDVRGQVDVFRGGEEIMARILVVAASDSQKKDRTRYG